MTEPIKIWIIIFFLGIGTYLIRFSFLGLVGDRQLPKWFIHSQVSEQILEEIAMCKVVEGLISRCQKDRVDMVLADALAEAAQVDMARDECVSTPHNQPRKGVWEDV